MLNLKGPDGDLGVIIARFQTPSLTPAHCELIETVRDRHKKFLIILGIAPVCPSTKNPMDFATRWTMIQVTYPNTIVLGIPDSRSDEIWSNRVDSEIRNLFPHEKVVLYGSRDSFIKHYTGKFSTVELDSNLPISSTEMRKNAFHTIRDTEDFRRGICYACGNQYRKNVLCVDVAIINPNQQQLLLGRKLEDNGKWRFFGGHVNAKETAEAAARREALEETGASIDGLLYLGTAPIDDWRYSGIPDSIFTIFYAGVFQYGHIKSSDDIDGDISWFNYNELKADMFVPEHRILFELFREKIITKE